MLQQWLKRSRQFLTSRGEVTRLLLAGNPGKVSG
jgi:hypothetical protein